MQENQNAIATKANINGISSESKTEEASANQKSPSITRFLIALRVWSLSASIIPTILGKSQKLRRVAVDLATSVKFPERNAHRKQMLCDTENP
jgi:hypothetical protein